MGKTIKVHGFPHIVSAEAVKTCIEKHTGKGSIYAIEVKMSKGGTKRAYAIVQFKTNESSEQIMGLANQQQSLFYRTNTLKAKELENQIVEPKVYQNQLDKLVLCFGCQTSREGFCVLWRKRNVTIKFGIGLKNFYMFLFYGSSQYKLQFPSEDIWKIAQYNPRGHNAKFLVIQLLAAPRVYKKTEDSIYRFYMETPDDQWLRTTDFTENCIIGQSSALCFKLPLHIQPPSFHGNANFAYHYENTTHFALENCSPYSSLDSDLVPIVHPPLGVDIPFEILFKVCVLVQHGRLQGVSLDGDFYALVDPKRVETKRVEIALEKMFHLKECCYDPVRWLSEEYGRFKQHPKSSSSPHLRLANNERGLFFVCVRRVLVTPLRVYFFGPEASLSNRVLRHFRDDIDSFLRVSFVDEDWDKMHSLDLSPRSSSSGVVRTDIYKRILTTLENGIVIGDKRFEFLAFSSSQLRESSVWMFASRRGLSAADIRAWMGNFQQIKNVAKYAARLGQSFGSSRETLTVPRHDTEIIPDIELHNEGGAKYVFSDGIGKICRELAEKVSKKLGLAKTPSAFQIRYGGYKGVVAVDPHSSKKLSLRNSMLKYESENKKLDVLAWSRYQPCYLNRQIVTLLSTLGITDEVFKTKQREAIGELDEILTNPDKTLLFLAQTMPGGENANVLSEMLRCGYKPDSEPFLSMMLRTIRASKLNDLRTKTRIFVPEGRSMMGCLDESGELGYGQVFVQFSGGSGGGEEIDGAVVVGKVVVAKNPCLHPGDVRVLEAVDVVGLHHMVDCIVFPQKGERPHPNECSGSDLDGDIYFVCWDQHLIPKCMVSPMDYTPAPITQVDHQITIQEICKYFVDYVSNDNLGTISNAHVVFADIEPNKAMSDSCTQLARLFSIAVDFPKTGIAADVPPHLRVKAYPDFMEKTEKPSYESTQIIGKLYRQVINIPESGMKSAMKLYDPEMEFDGFEDFIGEAFDFKSEYDYKLGNLMNYYGIKSEAEILIGRRISDPAAPRSFDRRRDGEAVSLAVRSLRREARSWLLERGSDFGDMRAKASAWYFVTYHHLYRARFISFPWCVYEVLIEIKKLKSNAKWGLQHFNSLEWQCNIC